MSKQVAEKFVEALKKLEAERDVETIVETFADSAEIGNVVSPHKFQGRDGAREFWTKYRETFGDMKSDFRNIFAGENRAALEWTTTGTSSKGDAIEYEGVSILEIEADKVTRFHAYFNAGDLGRQIVKDSQAAQEEAKAEVAK